MFRNERMSVNYYISQIKHFSKCECLIQICRLACDLTSLLLVYNGDIK